MQQYLTRKSLSIEQKVATIILGFGLNYLYIIVFQLFFTSLKFVTLTELIYKPESLIGGFIMTVVVAPLWEEVVFRIGLVSFSENVAHHFMVPIMISSSALFGWLHGGPMNVLIQGIGGFIIAGVYIKNGYCYRSAVALHAIWNFVWFMQTYILV